MVFVARDSMFQGHPSDDDGPMAALLSDLTPTSAMACTIAVESGC